MTDMMIAGVSSETGLTIATVARPAPAPGQVLIKVAAAGLNRADLNAAKGAGVASKASLGKPIGMEWAGEIVALGDGVTTLSVGQVVLASGSGGYAQYAVADHGRTLPIEGLGLSIEEAAALPLALMTAHDAVITNGRLKKGGVVLVNGASSAVGLAAMQIARVMGASLVIGTATNDQRLTRLKDHGAHLAIDARSPNWHEQVLEATSTRGANVVVDMVGGDTVNTSMRASAVLGRIVNVGRLAGVMSNFDLDLHSLKRLSYIGTTFRTRNVDEVREIVRQMKHNLWSAIASGSIRLPVDRCFALDDAAAAHAYMAANSHFGKIVLKP
jgi:NADPH2:quinone reductase